MNEYLKILDEIEEVRQRAAENPANYPADFVARVCAAIVARAARYESRADWTDELKVNTSKYAARLESGNFHL